MKPHQVKQIESPMFRLDPATKLQEFHKEHEQMRNEIIMLKKNLAFLEQRNHEMLKNEIQYRNLIKSYQNELRKNNKFELLSDLSEKHQLSITDIHKEINANISDLQGKVDRILGNREEMIVSLFNTKLREINENLEKEKREKFEDLEKGAAKKNLLKQELDMLKGSIGVIEAKNAHLDSQNKEFKHLLKMKDMEINALQKRIFEYKERNVTFPDIKTSRNAEIHSKSQKEIKTASMGIETDSKEDESSARYQKIIVKLQKLLALEKNNVRAARNAYFRELNSRSEIEETIISCIEEVKKERKSGKKNNFQLSFHMAIAEKLANSESILSKLQEFLKHKCETSQLT